MLTTGHRSDPSRPLKKQRRRAPLLLAACVASFLSSPAVLRCQAYTEDDGGDVIVGDGDVRIRLLTWNSGKEDLSEEAARLFDDDRRSRIQIVAVCQQEAKKSLPKFMQERHNSTWALVAWGKQVGWAGGLDRNSQILSVFYRRPKGAEVKGGEIETIEWVDKTVKVVHKWKTESKIEGHVTGSSRAHLRSPTGKGGVSSILTLLAKPGREEMRIALICGHLSSEKDDKRDADFKMMLAGGMRRDPEFAGPPKLWAKKYNVEKLVKERQFSPKELFEPPKVGGEDWLDAVVLFGDLNYRLVHRPGKYDLQDDQVMASFLAGHWRPSAALDDPLNPDGEVAKEFVSQQGWRMLCNQPHTLYLPTYKLNDVEACRRLAEEAATFVTPSASDVRRCFGPSEKKGRLSKKDWPLKKDIFLQAGWLDRACWRTVDQSKATVSLVGDEAWHDVDGSDHTPVLIELSIAKSAPRSW